MIIFKSIIIFECEIKQMIIILINFDYCLCRNLEKRDFFLDGFDDGEKKYVVMDWLHKRAFINILNRIKFKMKKIIKLISS